MRPTFTRASFLAASLVLACCDRPAIGLSESLVGAKELPSARTLARETIQISTGFHDLSPASPGNLSYELRPDNSLSITLTKYSRKANKQETVSHETLHLSSDAGKHARRMLWRLRPEPLQGIEYLILPTGCPHPPADAAADYFIDFIAEGPKPGIGDDRLGIFELPSASDCRTTQAVEARELVHKVLKSLPESSVADEFGRRLRRWDAMR